LFFVLGTLAAVKEIKRQSEPQAGIFLLLIASSPLGWVHSRINWSSSYLLGCFSFLLAELLRQRRTQEVRWIWLGSLAGLSLEFHPTAALGLVGLGILNLKILFRSALKNKLRVLAGTGFFILFALPELLHFPPPVGGAGEKGKSFWTEIPYLLGAIIGRRPIFLRYGFDTLPIWINAVFFIALIPIIIVGWWKIRKKYPQSKGDFWILSGVSIVLVFSSYLHRSLQILGHERYLCFLLPLWAYLISEGIFGFYQSSEVRKKFVIGLLGALVLLQQFRLTFPLLLSMRSQDPSKVAAGWLVENCPKSNCVAYAETFWNYWPILYYSNQQIDLNIDPRNWHTMPPQHKWTPHSTQNREIAGCWYNPNMVPQNNLARKSLTTLGQVDSSGQFCYLGINSIY
jgi:hypothetical protein